VSLFEDGPKLARLHVLSIDPSFDRQRLEVYPYRFNSGLSMEAPAGYEMGMRNPIKGVTMRTTMIVLAVAGLWLAASRADAQSGQRRGGLWVEAGLGHGTMNVSCDSVCFGGPRTGGTAGFVEVAAVDQHFRMGGALHVWWHSDPPDFTSSASASQRLTNIGAVLHY